MEGCLYDCYVHTIYPKIYNMYYQTTDTHTCLF